MRRIGDLEEWEPGALHGAVRREAERQGSWYPRLDMVRVWILAARSRGIVLRSSDDSRGKDI